MNLFASEHRRKLYVGGGAALTLGVVTVWAMQRRGRSSGLTLGPGSGGTSRGLTGGKSPLRPGGPSPRLDVSSLHPQFAPLVTEWMKRVKAAGIQIFITSTFRTPEMQDALYAEGRLPCAKVQELRRKAGMSDKGCDRIVPPGGKTLTNANSSDESKWSWHQVGLAFDFGVLDPKGQPYGDPRRTGIVPPEWRRAVEIGKAMGFIWGGDFKSPYDPVHFEWHPKHSNTRTFVTAFKAGTLLDTQVAGLGTVDDLLPDGLWVGRLECCGRLMGVRYTRTAARLSRS